MGLFRIIGLLFCAVTATAQAQNATTAGTPVAPYPTIHHLSIEWPITGDTNNNGRATVRYRPQGQLDWLDALDLRRVPAGSNQGFSWTNRHSGSLFDLQPATSYEIELTLTDPDGGNSTRSLLASTRALPRYPAIPNYRPATPSTLSAIIANAQPGDVIVLQPGTYAGFDFPRDGEPDQPIVLQGQEGALIQGELGLFFRHDVYLDALNVAGRIRFNGSDRITITHCLVQASATQFNGDGIVSLLRSENAYIADNTVIGVTPWIESAMGASGNNRGEGIVVTGPGHVIEHNRVSGFRDGISLLEDTASVDQFSIDIIENELSENLDDAVEADFCQHNCRILRNRATNSFVAFSSQPSLGGPTWFIRNVAYNVAHVGFKLYRGSIGDVLIHNTVVKAGDALSMYAGAAIDRLYSRNNLLIGGTGNVINGFSNGSGRVIQISDLIIQSADLDYDALGSATGSFNGRFGPSISFASVAEMQSLTSEVHGLMVDTSVFAQAIVVPSDPLVQFFSQDLRLTASNAAIDSGEVLSNINQDYTGTAPDAGAYEFGENIPEYGPRFGALLQDGFESDL